MEIQEKKEYQRGHGDSARVLFVYIDLCEISKCVWSLLK